MTFDYLRKRGLTVHDHQEAIIATGGAIAEVCQAPPPAATVGRGADRAVEILRKRNTA